MSDNPHHVVSTNTLSVADAQAEPNQTESSKDTNRHGQKTER